MTGRKRDAHMENYDVAIVGGGPGGYVAAIRAAQLGLKVALVEKDALGGLCLNWGCIPSKALLRNAEVVSLFRKAKEFGISFENPRYDLGLAIDRSRRVVSRLVRGVEFLMKQNKIDVFQGEGYLASVNRVEIRPQGQVVEAKNIIIATGAKQKRLSNLPVDGQRVVTSREALELKKLPSSIAIVGGGATGVEFAYFYRAYGSEVTLMEMMPHIIPGEDEETADILEKALTKQGIKIITKTTVEGLKPKNGAVAIRIASADGPRELEAEKVLVAVGMEGASSGLGLEALGVAVERSFISVDHRMATNVPGVYAVGDVAGPPLLAHVASAQGVVAVEAIAGRAPLELDYEQMPRAVYCQPQVASFGLTEAQARERGYEIKVGRFPLRASGKALALGEDEGQIKIVSDARYGEILGAQLIGYEVTELLPVLSLARALEATPSEIGNLVIAHPTLAEAIKEAALAVEGEAIHI